MKNKKTTIPELINLLKTVKSTLKKEGKTVMLVNSSGSKKSSKNKKRKITKKKRGATKETSSKGTYFHCGKDGPLEEKLHGLHGVEEEGGM